MPEFLVETYMPRDGAAAVAEATARATQAADDVAVEGSCVRLVRSIFVPEDETCFYLFDAETVDLVHAAASLAGLPVDRVTQAVAAANPARAQE